MTECKSCGGQNRQTANFCKYCGQGIAAEETGGLLGSLVGLDPIRQALLQLQTQIEGKRRAGRDVNSRITMLIIADAGAAKSRLGPLIAQALFSMKRITRARPELINALQQDDLDSKKLADAFEKARDGMLFIDNAHQMLGPKGEPLAPFNQVMHLIDTGGNNPVVVMAGLPHRLQEFAARPEYLSLLGLFTHVLRVDDYTPDVLLQIALDSLTARGFSPSDDVRDRLAMRMRWLYRKVKSGDQKPGEPLIRSRNGRMALDEASEIETRYYLRQGGDNVLQVDDVNGEYDKVKSIDEIMAELDALIGMESIKREVKALYKDIQNASRRQAMGLGKAKDGRFAYHFVLTGNPGTGKTTVARLLGRVFEALGVLPTGQVVEVDRSKLVGEFQGHTAVKVVAACKQAEGGVLFVDEAYALNQGTNDAFGKEAVDTLLKRMEDDRGRYVVIAAGYDTEMQNFLRTNPGLQSRFNKFFHLEDYTADELTAIFQSVAKGEGYDMGPGTTERVQEFFADRCARRTKDFANGREARNLVATVMRAQSERLSLLDTEPDAQTMSTLMPEDVPMVSSGSEGLLEASMAELDAMIGLKGVKDAIKRLQSSLARQRALGNNKPLSRHFVFTGNPGTGKTTVAKLMAKIFKGMGLLPTDRLVEVTRTELVSAFRAETPKVTNQHIDNAMGGVLFIDEAYSLLPPGAIGDPGIEAVNTLLKRMEDDRGKFVVIAAGYHREMDAFLDSNSGLRSRFSDYIDFADYDAEDMQLIFEAMCEADGVTREAGFDVALHEYLEQVYTNRDRNFANGRTVRQFYDKVCEACSARVDQLSLPADQAALELRKLALADLQEARQLTSTTPGI